MRDIMNPSPGGSSYSAAAVTQINRVLRRVYAWMTGGLAITAVVSLAVASSENLIAALLGNTLLLILLVVAELGLVIYLSTRILKMSLQNASILFMLFAALNGITLAPIFLIYTSVSIATTFFITAGTFGLLSIWAMSTKRDLSRWGHYLFFALIGIIIASLVNIFLRSSTFDLIISAIGVLLFMGLTAFDTQRIARWASGADPNISKNESVAKLAIVGALKLYLDFINLFLFLLRFLGRRR